jgi:hypothetical protein
MFQPGKVQMIEIITGRKRRFAFYAPTGELIRDEENTRPKSMADETEKAKKTAAVEKE